jgi:hypothetical protein
LPPPAAPFAIRSERASDVAALLDACFGDEAEHLLRDAARRSLLRQAARAVGRATVSSATTSTGASPRGPKDAGRMRKTAEKVNEMAARMLTELKD